MGKHYVPSNWQSLLIDALTDHSLTINGVLHYPKYHFDSFYTSTKKEVSLDDQIAMLAILDALNRKFAFNIINNRIVLKISNSFTAVINFINDKNDTVQGVYRNNFLHPNKDSAYNKDSEYIYSIHGQQTGSLRCIVPSGYVIKHLNYTTFIKFKSAPLMI